MTPTPSPDREPSTVDATLDDVRHFYRLMMEGHPSGAALFDAAASDYMANLLDNDADQDGRPDTAELQRLTEQSKRLTAAVPPVPLSPAPQPVITAEMLRAAETHHGDSCSYCNSVGDIDCPTAAILDALAPTDGEP